MNKTKLPVLVLKNIILFPHSEIRLELENNKDKELISLADAYYNKHILIMHPLDALEDSIELPFPAEKFLKIMLKACNMIMMNSLKFVMIYYSLDIETMIVLI